MNWGRGLLRIALLVAIVWAFRALATLWSADGCRLIDDADGNWCKYALMFRIVESFYLPPVSILLLVLAFAWVVRGFRTID